MVTMSMEQAEAFFKEYGGLKFQMDREDHYRMQLYERLHIPAETEERWRRELEQEKESCPQAPAPWFHMDRGPVTTSESTLRPDVLDALIRMSEDWEAEGSCHGYRRNTREDIEGNRIFLARVDVMIVGYLFGHIEVKTEGSSVVPAGARVFEVEELYVRPDYRSCGIGRQLFERAQEAVEGEADFLMVSTATKNWKAILHFCLEELGMEFWSARLYKKLGQK